MNILKLFICLSTCMVTIHCLYAKEKTYPEVICPINTQTIESIKALKPHVYAEFGISVGATAIKVASLLPDGAEIYLFDFHEKVEEVKKKILQQNPNVIVHALGNSYKLRDSYNWTLLDLLKKHSQPLFDYVYLDGMHTWETDGFAFMLIDLLLKPGGYIDLDDYEWSLSISGTLSPTAFPLTAALYTPQQIQAQSIKDVVQILLRRNNNYEEIGNNKRNKVFRKKGPNKHYS